ncbi:MAG: AzlC family ABC transporter permease [Lachnospiraceae bacterium]|nr:AzlC family ABC transporter permease [Lachnospiraceae bacterium]
MDKRQAYLNGLRDGIPIGLGYFVVSFSLGIIAKKAGLTPVDGFFASFFAAASAGEYAAFLMILSSAPYFNTFVISLITNARYMLMTTALSQRFSQKTPIWQRVLVAFYASDEIFGATIARPGYIMPTYSYGLSTVAIPLWSLGTALGVVAGNVLPMRVISALSVALYGMFLAIIVPPSKKDTAVLLAVIASFISSYLCGILPVISTWNSSTITILLTIVISSIAAIVRPRADVEGEEEEA